MTVRVPSKSKRKRTSLSPAARTDELAAKRAVRHGEVVPVVDLGIAHAARAFLLALPVHVHEPGELVQVAAFECPLALEAEVLDEMEVLYHALVGGLALVVLFLEDLGG